MAWRRYSLLLLGATVALIGAGVSLALRAQPPAARTTARRATGNAQLKGRPADSTTGRRHWVVAWAAGTQGPVDANLSSGGFRDQTLREIVVSSAQGSMIRVRVTNTFGTRFLRIGRVSVARQLAGAGAQAKTRRMVTFEGRSSAVVAPGTTLVSDPVRFGMRPLSRLLISIYLPTATGPATEHRDARQINYVARGDHALDVSGAAFAGKTGSWFFLAGIDALAPPRNYGAVVALGDSITDGLGSPVNANQRWPNFLTRRLSMRKGRTLSVVDEGMGGNRVLDNSTCCGVSAVTRFASDVRGQASARIMILLEGINDIGLAHRSLASPRAGSDRLTQRIIAAYQRIIRLAHAAGIKVFGGTLTPFQGALYWTPEGETIREAVNDWIRTSGTFDGVIDFARATQAGFDSKRLAPAYDSGDHLHLNAAGYRAMANAVDVAALFRELSLP